MRSLVRFALDSTPNTTSTELATLARGRRIDRDALAAYLSQDAPLPTSRSLYEGVSMQLVPGVWGAPVLPLPRARSAGEALARVRDVLEKCVEAAVAGAKRVAVFASGGIDSSTILALAKEITERNGGTAFALAIDFASPGDDRPHLRALEEQLRCDVVRVKPADGARFLAPVHDGIDAAPLFWAYTPLQLALYAAARAEGADLVLTGSGGDDFFDGSPRAFADHAKRHPIDAVRRVRRLRDFWTSPSPVLEHIVRPLVAARIPISVRRRLARRTRGRPQNTPWASPLLRQVTERLADRALEETLAGPRDGAAYLASQHYYAFLVQQEQRGGGLERREPMFTEEVAAVVESIPPHLLLAGDRRRGLLREAMRGKVPDSILDRPDKAQFAPSFPLFFAAAGGAIAFREELEGRMLARLGLVESASFCREVTRALEEPDEQGRYGLAWAALAAEAFLLRHPEAA